MVRVLRPALGGILVLGLLLCTSAAPANNATKVSSPALTLTDGDGEQSSNPSPTSVDLCNSKDSEIDCNQTEYKAYMECVENKRTTRKKRQTQCPNLVNSIAPVTHMETSVSDPVALTKCQFEQRGCIVGCRNDEACVDGCPTCDESLVPSVPLDSNCLGDYNDCVTNCAPGQPCETTCRSLCNNPRPLGYKTVIFEGHNGGPSDKVQVPIGIPHNITTIIKLNNFINNTNTINVPTNITNTNLNTIHLYTNSSTDGGQYNLGQTKDGSCCFAVHPKTCRTSTAGLRCQHRRHKTCGSQCTSRVIHVQSRKKCNNRGKCKASVSYVPEPSPKCHYANQWPYVSCGGARKQNNCNGCYDHYGENYLHQQHVPQRCHPCFDNGYDTGPLYRQGPFYRPNFYHQSPCYMTGSCYPMGGYDYGYYAPPPPQPPQYYPAPPIPMPMPDEMYPEDPDPNFNELYPGDDEYSGYEPVEEQNFNEKEWDKVVQKCKVINVDDSTVIIKNCTTGDLVENPYASNRVDDKSNNNKDDLNEEYDMMPAPERMPYYQPNAYNPYSYYPAPAPPMAPYYGAAYYPAPYYPRPMPHRRNNNPQGPVRPYPIDNYGSDEADYGEAQDDFWKDDEEKDLLEKGYEKVKEF